MKREPAARPLSLYRSSAGDLRLLLTGVGMLPAAMTLTQYCTKYGVSEDTQLVNIGTACGETPGAVYLANRLYDLTVEKAFYPDILYRSPFPELLVATSPVMIRDYGAAAKALPPTMRPVIFDMEAAALYQAASRFLSPHRMSFLKVVSDSGALLSENGITALIEEKADAIAGALEEIQGLPKALFPMSGAAACKNTSCRDGEDGTLSLPDTAEREQAITAFSADIRASEAMTAQVRRLFTYLSLTGRDYRTVIRDLKEDGALPCASKREGKKLLDALKQALLP